MQDASVTHHPVPAPVTKPPPQLSISCHLVACITADPLCHACQLSCGHSVGAAFHLLACLLDTLPDTLLDSLQDTLSCNGSNLLPCLLDTLPDTVFKRQSIRCDCQLPCLLTHHAARHTTCPKQTPSCIAEELAPNPCMPLPATACPARNTPSH